MTDRELMENLVDAGKSAEVCPHGDTCHFCRHRRLTGQVAQEFLDRGEIDPVKAMMEAWSRFRPQEVN